MAKILKNTSVSSIELIEFGVQIPALTNYTVQPQDYLLLSTSAVITELTTRINAGTIVVNDGTSDITNLTDAVRFLNYPDDTRSIDFDNSTNGFISKTAQKAIEEARNNSQLADTEATATAVVSTSSATYTTISGMTITPVAGQYLVLFSATAATTGVNGTGDVALFIDNTEQTGTQRRVACSTAILGLITLSTNLIAAPVAINAVVNVNGSQAINVRYRENDNDSFKIASRRLTILKIGDL